ncbi:MAG: TonB-dependent receptor plug domain-containing protein, partial [Gammaproteobacteria bacterium]
MLAPLVVGVALSSLAPTAATQSAPAEVTRLTPITVTATRVPTPGFDVPAAISVITRDQIRQGPPGASLAQTLARVPGLVAQNRQSYAQDLQLSLRGFGARASFGVRGIRLLMDGLPLSLPDGQGETDPFDLAIAQRIEVLRGPFSTLYGNAAGGVIQVFTENGPARPTVGAHLMLGSYGTRVERFQGGGTAGAFNYIANFSRFATDGYRDHSAAEREHLYTKLRYTPSENTKLTFLFNAENQPYAEDPSGLTAEQVAENPRQAVPAVY